jgi:acetyl esterase/lipase
MRKLFRVALIASSVGLCAAFGGEPPPKAKGKMNVAPPPPGVKKLSDIAYVKGGHERQVLDLFLPENAKNLPLVVWVHGGGWQNGSKDRTPAIPLLSKGYALASINYRLSSHAVFPAQIEDCKAAIRWLRAHAKEHGYDASRIAAWGSSAGGHLVAMLGVTGEVKEFDTGENLHESSRVQAVVDYFGPTELLMMGKQSKVTGPVDHDAPNSPEARLIGGSLQENEAKARRASPITYVSKDDAPMLIVHGDADLVVPLAQSETFLAALRKSGVDASLYVVTGGGHGGFRDPEVPQRVEAFLERVLKTSKVARAND